MKIFLILLLFTFSYADYQISPFTRINLDKEVTINSLDGFKEPYQIKNENKFVINFKKEITDKLISEKVDHSLLKYIKILKIKHHTRVVLIFNKEMKMKIKKNSVVFIEKDIQKTIPKVENNSKTLNNIVFNNSAEPIEFIFGYKTDFSLIKNNEENYSLVINDILQPKEQILKPYYPHIGIPGIKFVNPVFKEQKLFIEIQSDQKITAFSNETSIKIKVLN